MGASDDADAELLTAARSGDAGAFTALVRRHDRAVRAYVFALAQRPADIDDLMQDTYLRAYRSLASFDGRSTFRTWVHRIAHNVAIDAVRRSRKVESIAPDSELFERSAETGDPGVRLEVAEALTRLNERQRAAVLLIDGHGFDYAATAAILGIPAGTVGFHLHRARKALRNALAPNSEREQS